MRKWRGENVSVYGLGITALLMCGTELFFSGNHMLLKGRILATLDGCAQTVAYVET